MGLFDWVKGGSRAPSAGKQASSAAPKAEVAKPALTLVPPAAAVRVGAIQEAPQTAGGLDFATAIQAHRNWKSRLAKYVDGNSDEQLDYRVICRDDQCALGKWIHGSGGADFGHLPSFEELKAMHGQFHHAAGEVVRLHDEHKDREAQRQLRAGEYPRYSIKVMGLLSLLYLEVAEADKRAA